MNRLQKWSLRLAYGLAVLAPLAAGANYLATQGSGTTFGSIVVSTVHYAQMLVCDSVAPANCAAVKAASTAAVATDPAVVVRVNPGDAVATGISSIATNTSSPVPAGTNTIGGVFGAPNVTPTDCSGTITSGGTAQNAFTATAGKHGFTIVNLSADPMWISFTGTAVIGTQASYLLAAGSATVQGGSFTSPLGFGMNTALSVIAATTADKFSCTFW
jgi:hypothetical protein